MAASGGYEFSNAPMALGVTLLKANSKEKGSPSSGEINVAILGWGYRLSNNYFLGVNYSNMNLKGNGYNITTQRYSIGGGKVFGDLKNPLAAIEVYIDRQDSNYTSYNLKGLKNIENVQLYSELSIANQESYESKTATVGVDFQFSKMYVGPQVTYAVSNESLKSELDLSLEAGYRVRPLEIYARYGKLEAENFPITFIPTEKRNVTEFSVGGSYSL